MESWEETVDWLSQESGKSEAATGEKYGLDNFSQAGAKTLRLQLQALPETGQSILMNG